MVSRISSVAIHEQCRFVPKLFQLLPSQGQSLLLLSIGCLPYSTLLPLVSEQLWILTERICWCGSWWFNELTMTLKTLLSIRYMILYHSHYCWVLVSKEVCMNNNTFANYFCLAVQLAFYLWPGHEAWYYEANSYENWKASSYWNLLAWSGTEIPLSYSEPDNHHPPQSTNRWYWMHTQQSISMNIAENSQCRKS